MSAPTAFRIRFEYFKLFLKILLSGLYGIACLLTILALYFGAFDSAGSGAKYIAYAFLSGFVVWMVRERLAAGRRLVKAIQHANTQHGTSFDLHKSMGFRHGVEVTLFDPERRKVLFLKHDGRFQWVYGFAQIESWKVSWTDNTRRHRISEKWVTERVAVRLQFFLNDVSMPSITMAIANYETAKDWSQRLSILMRQLAKHDKGHAR